MTWSLTAWHRSLSAAPLSSNQAARRFLLEEPRELERLDHRHLWATYYYLPTVRSSRNGVPLRDLAGRPLGPELSLEDWCEAALQGSVQVDTEGGLRILNFAGRTGSHLVDCSGYYRGYLGRTKFRDARGRYGDGVEGYSLVPFRTLAVDHRVIPHGSAVFIPAAKGTVVPLPGGEQVLHDGYFFAADAGSAIRGSQVDVYLGPVRENPFRWVRSSPRGTVDAYLLRSGRELEVLSSLHRGRSSG